MIQLSSQAQRSIGNRTLLLGVVEGGVCLIANTIFIFERGKGNRTYNLADVSHTYLLEGLQGVYKDRPS